MKMIHEKGRHSFKLGKKNTKISKMGFNVVKLKCVENITKIFHFFDDICLTHVFLNFKNSIVDENL